MFKLMSQITKNQFTPQEKEKHYITYFQLFFLYSSLILNNANADTFLCNSS